MFKLPSLPTVSAGIHELADFVELLTWTRGTVSIRDVCAYLGQVDDNDQREGVEDSQDHILETLDAVMHEIEARCHACRAYYPFRQDATGTVLRNDPTKLNALRGRVYCYLLLSTRMNMDKDRVLEDIDATHLLEQLAKAVLRNYLGKDARSLVFGTSDHDHKGFADKVNHLCRELGEGGGYTSLIGQTRRSGDGKLDVVAWKAFTDALPGKLILFAQCKTGTSWRSELTQLQPTQFCNKWIQGPFGVVPMRTFVVSEAEDRVRFPETVQDAGLLFDRCRITDLCPDLESELVQRLTRWTDAAFALAKHAIDRSPVDAGR